MLIKYVHEISLTFKLSKCFNPEKIQDGKNTNESCQPTMSLSLPAPKVIMELVKCGCKKSCAKSSCSCQKNNLVCTPLCKCIDCENSSDYFVQDEIDDPDLED